MHSRILDEHSKKAVHNYSDFLEARKKYLLHCTRLDLSLKKRLKAAHYHSVNQIAHTQNESKLSSVQYSSVQLKKGWGWLAVHWLSDANSLSLEGPPWCISRVNVRARVWRRRDACFVKYVLSGRAGARQPGAKDVVWRVDRQSMDGRIGRIGPQPHPNPLYWVFCQIWTMSKNEEYFTFHCLERPIIICNT